MLLTNQTMGSIAHIQFRIYLVDLINFYIKYRKANGWDWNRAYTDSQAISNITAERFPLLKRDSLGYQQKCNVIQQRLYWDWNWHMIAVAYGRSILLLIPSGSTFNISYTGYVNE